MVKVEFIELKVSSMNEERYV